MSIDRTLLASCGRARGPSRDRLVVVEDLAAAFNGSLDNLDELLTLLGRVGTPRLVPLPPVILIAGFRAFGRSLPNHLRGVFAGVLTDGHKMWAFRDHLGFRTLFFRDESPAGLRGDRGKASSCRSRDQALTRCRRPGEDLLQRASRRVSLCPRRSQTTSQSAVMETQTHSSTFERYWKPEALLETGRYSYERSPTIRFIAHDRGRAHAHRHGRVSLAVVSIPPSCGLRS